MNYFQQYETERKHLKVGKMWICVDPESIAQNSECINEIIEIVDFDFDAILETFYIRYKVLTGRYKDVKRVYSTQRSLFIKCYKPYTGAKPSENEEVSNV